jgi:hypothetical protein
MLIDIDEMTLIKIQREIELYDEQAKETSSDWLACMDMAKIDGIILILDILGIKEAVLGDSE